MPFYIKPFLCELTMMQIVVTALVAMCMAPCVLQRICNTSFARPPSSVCMHRIENSIIRKQSGSRKKCRGSGELVTEDARAHKSSVSSLRARVSVRALLWVPLVAVLLSLSLLLPPRLEMSWLLTLMFVGTFAGVYQATPDCKTCIALGKEEKAMFRAHSDACLPQSHVDPKLVDALLNGELTEDPALKSHVYCVLLKCKVISKDGKLQKTAVLGKMANRADRKNATKVLENCSELTGDTPEELAWNIFRCGYDKKAVLFNYMPINDGKGDIENNSN